MREGGRGRGRHGGIKGEKEGRGREGMGEMGERESEGGNDRGEGKIGRDRTIYINVHIMGCGLN